MIQKPSYGTTKTQMRWAFALAWMTIETLILGALSGIHYAVELAPIVIPSMILLIAAMLGIHRYTGSLDFRAAQDLAAQVPSSPPYNPRDDPESEIR